MIFLCFRPSNVQIQPQRPSRLAGSYGSLSSASGTSPVSSEGKPESVNSRQYAARGGSLDQLYSGTTVDVYDELNNAQDDLKDTRKHDKLMELTIKLAEAENENNNISNEYNRYVRS